MRTAFAAGGLRFPERSETNTVILREVLGPVKAKGSRANAYLS